jgi:hypothetical protein
MDPPRHAAAAAPVPPAADSYTASSGEILVPPRGPSSALVAVPPGTPSTSFMTRETPSSSFDPPAGQRMTPSAPFPASSAPATTSPARARGPWPLYAVIGGAALAASIVVAIAMQPSALAPSAHVAKPIDPERAPVAPPKITVVPIEPSAEAPSDTAVRAAFADATGSAAKPLPAKPRRGATAKPAGDDLARAAAEGHHDKVLALCSAGPITAERAPLCFLAACHTGDDARARKLFAAVPAAARERAIASCQQLGIDVTKPTKPVVDCEADPMACQH